MTAPAQDPIRELAESMTKKRFMRFVRMDAKTGCWLWTGNCDRRYGYGRFSVGGRKQLAHRVSWLMSGGEITKSKPCVLHRCDTPECVNPAHLFAGSVADNNLDMAAKGRGKSGPLPFGVARVRGSRKFRAGVHLGGRAYHLGTYDTKELAHRAAIKKKFELLRSLPALEEK